MVIETPQLSFERYERELLDPLKGHQLSDIESYVASLLLDATSEKPIDNDTIRAAIRASLSVRVDGRKVKDIIRTLRKDHLFPIIARRKRPSGYWWCHSAQEMESFIETFRSQALDELHTIGRMVRENFPELAGQLRFDME